MAGFLQQIDANRDGQIDANEVQGLGPRAGMVEGMMRRAGLEPKYPVKVSAIQEAMQNGRNNWNRGGGPNGPPGENPGMPSGQGGPPANGDAKAVANAAPLVPGFGVEQKKQPVPGFAGTSKQAVSGTATSAATGDASSSAAAPASTPDQLDEKTRKFAESILRQNDKDKSGALEKSKGEWEEVRSKEAIDKDKNGIITLEEMTSFYQAANGVRANKGGPGNRAQASSIPVESFPKGTTYRILSPLERLPEGLPDWFARNDANADGQIAMSEYARDWSSEKASEFAGYDLNGDGIVTPQECLQKAGKN